MNEHKPPIDFIPASQLDDDDLAINIRRVITSSWNGKGRWQAASRLVSGRALLLAVRYSPSIDGNIYRDLENHVEGLEKKCKKLDEKEKAARASTAESATAQLIVSKSQLRRTLPRETPVLVAIEVQIEAWSRLDLALSHCPQGLTPWKAAQNMSPQRRVSLMRTASLRVADFAINTKRLSPQASSLDFFEHADAAEIVQGFLAAQRSAGGGSLGQQPLCRAIRAAFYFSICREAVAKRVHNRTLISPIQIVPEKKSTVKRSINVGSKMLSFHKCIFSYTNHTN